MGNEKILSCNIPQIDSSCESVIFHLISADGERSIFTTNLYVKEPLTLQLNLQGNEFYSQWHSRKISTSYYSMSKDLSTHSLWPLTYSIVPSRVVVFDDASVYVHGYNMNHSSG